MCPLEKDNLIEATLGAHEDSKKVDLMEIRSKTVPHHLKQKILKDLCSDTDSGINIQEYLNQNELPLISVEVSEKKIQSSVVFLIVFLVNQGN